MAASAKKSDEQYVQTAQVEEARHRPTAASALDAATPSPARMLQEALGVELPEPEVKKWPPIATLGFIVATCGSFWAVVAFGLSVMAK